MRASDRAYATLLDEIQRGRPAPRAPCSARSSRPRASASAAPRCARRSAASPPTASSPSSRRGSRSSTDVDADDIRELFEVRRALEETAARLAAERADAAAFAALADEFARAGLDADRELDAYYALIARFDAALDAAVANDYLTAALRTVRTHLVRVRRLARDNPDRLAASVAEHRLIASAIAARDADLAAHATHVHLHNALTNILDSLPDPSPGPETAAPPRRTRGPHLQKGQS